MGRRLSIRQGSDRGGPARWCLVAILVEETVAEGSLSRWSKPKADMSPWILRGTSSEGMGAWGEAEDSVNWIQSVFLYGGMQSTIVVLSSDLQTKRRIGRPGQGPGRRQNHEALTRWVQAHPDIGVVYRNLPLSQIHPMAQAVADASRLSADAERMDRPAQLDSLARLNGVAY